MTNSIIIGTGSCIPSNVVPNDYFLHNSFYDEKGILLPQSNLEIIQKFEEITGIKERRYVDKHMVASDIAFEAAKDVLHDIDPESLDCIIVAHNFGDMPYENRRSDIVPCLAARVKHLLGIRNPKTIAHDTPFGCPGWLLGMMQADCYIQLGMAKRALVIGTETLSRICDPHDRDSMIYADGAGATILEANEGDSKIGILSHAVRSDTLEHCRLLKMDRSNNPNYKGDDLFLKMQGQAVFKYALRYVPDVVKESLDKVGITLEEVKKIFIHQANAKLDEGVLKGIYGKNPIPPGIMPMTIGWLGNTSVATIPTLLDLVMKGKLNGHGIKSGDVIVFASVGAGMNINAMVYRMP